MDNNNGNLTESDENSTASRLRDAINTVSESAEEGGAKDTVKSPVIKQEKDKSIDKIILGDTNAPELPPQPVEKLISINENRVELFNGVFGDWSPIAGLHLIVAKSRGGKSSVLQAMYDIMDDVIQKANDKTTLSYLSMGEPSSFLSFNIETLLKSTQSKDIVFLDSFKNLFQHPSILRSAPGKGGISMTVYTFFSNLSQQLAMAGKTIIAVVNPMSLTVDEIYPLIDGNSTSAIQLDGFENNNAKIKGAYRRFMRQDEPDFQRRVRFELPMKRTEFSFKLNMNSVSLNMSDIDPDEVDGPLFQPAFPGSAESSTGLK